MGAKTNAVGIVLVMLGGVALAVQAGLNSLLGARAGSKSFAALVSFLTGTAACAAYFGGDVAYGHTAPTRAGMAAAPWWSWLGGPLGAFYVAVVTSFARRLGSATTVAAFVCAQLAASFVLDLAGVAGFPRRSFSWPRLVGVLLMAGGVVLVTRFPGELREPKDAATAAAAAAGADAEDAGGGG